MAQQTAPNLPDDYGAVRTPHVVVAGQMRDTDDWVHIGDYGNRISAQRIASDIRNGKLASYRGHLYDARAITTADGTHQVWGRWIGPKEVRR